MNKFRKALPSLVYLVVAAVFYWQSFSIISTDHIGIISATTIPRVIIALLAVCALLNLRNDLKKPDEEAAQPFINSPLKWLISIAVLLVSGMYAKKMGFVLVGFLFLGVMFNLLDDRPRSAKNILINIALAAVFSIVICYGFRYGLKVRLPLWPKL